MKRVFEKIQSVRLENLFISLFIVFGLFFVFMIPPGWNTDEPDHTYRISQLASGDLFSEKVVSPYGDKAYGGNVSTNLIKLYTESGVRDAGANAINTGQRVNTLYKDHPRILTYKDDGTKAPINFSGAALYSPLSYLLYLPVFIIGNITGMTFYAIIIISRIIGVLAVGFSFFYAIKRIAVGKWIVFAIGLLPVVIVQAATVGADAPSFALSILFVTFIVNAVFAKDRPTLKTYGILTVLGIALGLIKIGYAPMVVLVLSVPIVRGLWRDKKQLITAVLAVIASFIPALIWTKKVSYIDTNSNLQANFHLQEHFILHHPIIFTKTLYYTFFTNQQSPFANIFGDPVWASAHLPMVFSFLALTSIVMSLFVGDKLAKHFRPFSTKSLWIWRFVMIAIPVFTAIFIATILYIYSTTTYQSSISGIQARYFVPLLPFILIPLYGNFVKNQRVPKTAIICISVIVLVGMVLTVYHRLYQVLPTLLG